MPHRRVHSLAVALHELGALGVQLLHHGYVNTIPKDDGKGDSGQGKEGDGGGEGGGMGDGKG